MQRDLDSLISLVKLPDDDYFVPEEALQSRISNGLSQLPRVEGYAIGCPQVVDVDQHTRLPLVWASWTSNLRGWNVVEARNNAVVVADLSTGKISIHDPDHGPRKPDMRGVPMSREGKSQDIIAPKGFKGGAEVLDLRAVANIPWNPGRFAATLLVYDWPTNTIVVELQRKGAAPVANTTLPMPRAEAVELAYLQQRIARSPHPMYRFGTTSKTPFLTRSGLALAVPTEVSANKSELIVEGAGRLELLPANLIAPPAAGEVLAPNRPAAPAAFVRVSLLVARLDSRLRQIDLQVPVTTQHPLQAGNLVDVAFQVDLNSALHSQLPPGEYQIYAAGSRYFAGPYALVIKNR